MRGFSAISWRSLLVRALAEGCSEKQKMLKLITWRPTTKPRCAWPAPRAPLWDPSATLDDLREAVETLESVARVWTRVFGEAHPETSMVQNTLAAAHTVLAARAAASSGAA